MADKEELYESWCGGKKACGDQFVCHFNALMYIYVLIHKRIMYASYKIIL